MKTQILAASDENLHYCAKLLKEGYLVAVPTETVYGLAANAFDDDAVLKIFKLKGRPSDNPLICHIDSLNMFRSLTNDRFTILEKLINKFWPGPLTVVVKSCVKFSKYAVANLDTVGLRFSSNEILKKLINYCGFPLAAPSANLSKYPSATNPNHVLHDFNGKIAAILDGGQCEIGLESTVVKVDDDRCVLLRPGAVTLEMLEETIGKVILSKGLTERLDYNEKVLSPGLKHKHYSPKAKVIVVRGSFSSFVKYVSDKLNFRTYCVVFEDEIKFFNKFVLSFGKNSKQQAKNLFFILRQVDDLNLDKVFFRCPDETGLGFAVFNRLIRAANFEIVDL